MAFDFFVTLDEIDQKMILRLEGRLDVSSTPQLEKKMQPIIDDGHTVIYLDFSDIDYLSSAGLRLLLAKTQELKAKKGNLILFSLTDEVKEVVEVAGFKKVFTIFASEKEALKASH